MPLLPPPHHEVMLVTLANNDSALFVNGVVVHSLDGNESGTSPVTVATGLAEGLNVEIQTFHLDVPTDQDWNWLDVYELLPARAVVGSRNNVSAVDVAYWDSPYYHGARNDDAEHACRFSVSVDDQRESNGQIYIDVAEDGARIDDLCCVTVEINRLPGESTDMPCVHLHFDGDALAASVFKQGDRFIIRPETDVSIQPYQLANGEYVWVLE